MKTTILFMSMLLIFGAMSVHAATINPNLPGATHDVSQEGPAGLVANFYQLALAIGGLLAFGVIVYGAIKYTVSGGNSSMQHDAKEWITQALWGLLLLAGAALILTTINPAVFMPGNGSFQINTSVNLTPLPPSTP